MTMKKLTAMFLSLLMCFSLLAMTAQAACPPDEPNGPVIIGIGKTPIDPGDDGEDPDEPGNSVQSKLPDAKDDTPRD